MIIQHNSATKITEVETIFGEDLMGCLCFAAEGHTYNLANEINYSYTIDINEDKVLLMSSIWINHNSDELPWAANQLIEDMCEELEIDRDMALDYLDGSESYCDGWYVQQCMGLMARALGYDAAEDFDEQGAVYVVYCVDREMTEIAH